MVKILIYLTHTLTAEAEQDERPCLPVLALIPLASVLSSGLFSAVCVTGVNSLSVTLLLQLSSRHRSEVLSMSKKAVTNPGEKLQVLDELPSAWVRVLLAVRATAGVN